MKTLAILIPACLIAACGTRGPLTYPPGPAPAPVFGNPTPAKTTSAQAIRERADLSTPQKTSTQ